MLWACVSFYVYVYMSDCVYKLEETVFERGVKSMKASHKVLQLSYMCVYICVF